VPQRQIQGTIVQSNHITDTLLAATANLVERVIQAIDDQNRRNRNTIERLYSLGLSATVVAMGLALFVLVFIDQRILKRLRNFQQSLKTLTADPGKTDLIPVTGDDEIASMARSFEGLLAVIQTREQALRDNEERLQTLARQDALTGLPNRHYFFEVAQQEVHASIRRKEPLSVMMMDVDYFKAINDNYGHATGDEVLSTMGKALKNLVRGQDVVGRLGGEEFGILLPGTNQTDAMEVAERLRRGVEALQIRYEEHVLCLTVSIGIAQYQAGEQGIDHALSCADHALYCAKRAGRNQIVYGQDTPE
jgi:diguanylate cyclase (GGDEF)-like protein